MLMMITTIIVIVRIICFFNEWWVRFDYFGFRLKYFGPKHFQPQIRWRHGGREGVKVVTKEFSLDLLKPISHDWVRVHCLVLINADGAKTWKIWSKVPKYILCYISCLLSSDIIEQKLGNSQMYIFCLSKDTFWPSAIKGIGLQSDFLSWFLHFVALQYLFTSWRRITAQLYSHKEKQSSTMYDRCNRYNVQCKLYNHR